MNQPNEGNLEHQEGHLETKKRSSIADQIQSVVTALVDRKTNPTAELRKLDVAIEGSGESADALVESTARRLFQQNAVFENLNFQSSLLSGGSTFFGRVLRKMGELVEQEPALAEDAALPVRIRLVEHFRRGENADEMMKYASSVEEELAQRVQEKDTLALSQLAKVRYEQMMQAFNDKDYNGSIALGEESITLSEDAGDLYGVLAARGNTAGLVRYTWAKELRESNPEKSAQLLQEGLPILKDDLHTAQRKCLEGKDLSNAERNNFARVEMNDAMHLICIAQAKDDAVLGSQAMEILRMNPIYRESADEKWALEYEQIVDQLMVSAMRKQFKS